MKALGSRSRIFLRSQKGILKCLKIFPITAL